jgi:hypothetical protein
MKNIFYIILTFCILIKGESKAQESNKDVTITASGSGKTLDVAKQTALRGAIEQAFGTFISAKTEIFNDEVVADQIASVSSGNIKSFEMLNESQLPDGSWGVTLKAIVSVDKLTSFVQAKGVVVEIKGGLFALNIKQQMLNEEGEVKAIADMVGLLHEPMQTAFDYEIQTKNPVSTGAENWKVDYEVTAKTNKNMEFCSDYFIKTLRAVGMTPEEVKNYKSLNKKVFPIEVLCYGPKEPFLEQIVNNYFEPKIRKGTVFYLRNLNSVKAINSFLFNAHFYINLFEVQNGISLINEGEKKCVIGKSFLFGFRENLDYVHEGFKINLPKAGITYRKFYCSDQLSLTQIEQLTKYEVKPKGVVSQFKHGGYVVYEENGRGLVCSIFDVDENQTTLSLNGYDDWETPSIADFKLVTEKLINKQIANFAIANRNLNSKLTFDTVAFKYALREKVPGSNPKLRRFVRKFGNEAK